MIRSRTAAVGLLAFSVGMIVSPVSFAQDEDDAASPAGRTSSPFELDADVPPAEEPTAAEKAADEEPLLPDEKNLRADDPDIPDSSRFDEEHSSGPESDFRIGPTLSVGFPHPFNYSLEAMYGNTFGGGFSLGSGTLKQSDVRFSISNWDVRFRYHPFAKGFFGGLAYGQQKLTGETIKDLEFQKPIGEKESIETSLKLTVNSTYLTPHLGWFCVMDSGLVLGFELGYQMALKSKADFSADFASVPAEGDAAARNSETYTKNKKDIEDAGEALGKKGLPYVKLLRIGWLF